MKKFLKLTFATLVALAGLVATSCSDDSKSGGGLTPISLGAIYGMTVDAENTEPMRGVQVQLCNKAGSTIGSTVTYDDGHFEFADINPGEYTVVVSSTKYPDVRYNFTVEAGRTSSLDIPIGLYTNPYMPIYLSSNYGGSTFQIHLTTPDIHTIEPVEIGVYYSEYDNPMTTGAKANYYEYNDYRFTGEDTTMYFVQAYIKDANGNTYLSEIIGITEKAAAPEVKTTKITKVNASKVILEGEITHKGNPIYTERGFIVSIEFQNPTLQDLSAATTKIPVEGSELSFKYVLDIEEGIKYYIRAYAVNDGFVGYGNVFKIEDYAPEVKTEAATEITTDHATIFGEITNEGDPLYNERGFILSSELKNPTISDISDNTIKVIVEGSDKKYSKELINLKKETTYYYRAYAKSDKFTAYGDVENFTTEDGREWYEIGDLAVQLTDITPSGGSNWDAANNMCKNSLAGGNSGWRLPTVSEAYILFNNKYKISLATSSNYWTSEINDNPYYSGGGGIVYGHKYLSTANGEIREASNSNSYKARCVRDKKGMHQ